MNPSPELLEATERRKKASDRLAARTEQAEKVEASRGLSKVNTNAALEYARTVLFVEWLVKHPTERDQLSSIVELLATASEDLLKIAPQQERAALSKRILDHLWCDLVVSIVCAVEMVGKVESDAKDKFAGELAASAVKLLAEARGEERGKLEASSPKEKSETGADCDDAPELSVESAILEGCVRGVVNILLDAGTAAFDAHLKISLLKLRVAAIMICPDLMAHELVWKECWLPMWREAVFDAALEKFAHFVDGLKFDLGLVSPGNSTQ